MTEEYKNTTNTRPRKNELNVTVVFRADRLFTVSIQWYFSTREGKDQGPFINKQRAQRAIQSYLLEIQS